MKKTTAELISEKPEWQQDLLEQASKSMCDVPREPINPASANQTPTIHNADPAKHAQPQMIQEYSESHSTAYSEGWLEDAIDLNRRGHIDLSIDKVYNSVGYLKSISSLAHLNGCLNHRPTGVTPDFLLSLIISMLPIRSKLSNYGNACRYYASRYGMEPFDGANSEYGFEQEKDSTNICITPGKMSKGGVNPLRDILDRPPKPGSGGGKFIRRGCFTSLFQLGDKVKRRKNYKFPGEIVSVFRTRAGLVRYVVDCFSRDNEGCLHIFSERDLELLEDDYVK